MTNYTSNSYNSKQDTSSDRIIRGSIITENGTVLASTQVDYTGNEIEDAEKNVHFGSTEYKNAKTGFKSFNDKLTELSDPNHTISVKELEEFNRLMDQTEEDIDKYLHSKLMS